MSKTKNKNKKTIAAAVKKSPRPAAKTRPARAREVSTMSSQEDKIIALQGENEQLRAELKEVKSELRAANKELRELEPVGGDDETPAPAPGPRGVRPWVRGILPGDKLIKTNTQTGQVVTINKEEWDGLY
jgi:hypothetical protein